MRVTARVAQALNANTLTKSLADAGIVGNRLKGKSWDARKGAEIVSEKLCDDVVKYLAPTLEQHKGCTIIDVHPGVCLFSSKLHDFLRPKWHLLMEPESRYYEPFVKPLLDQPGSTYHYTTLSGANPQSYWANYQTIQNDPSLLPPRPALPDGDPRRRQLDPSMLVIGNLARFYNYRRKARFLDYAPLVLYQMAYGALGNEYFHGSGLVRMLWWLPEMFKVAVQSGTQAYSKRPGHVGLEMGVHISEVVGVKPSYLYRHQIRSNTVTRRRFGLYDEIRNQEVATRMRENGISVPEGRQVQKHELNNDSDDRETPFKSPLTITVDNLSALQEKIDQASKRFNELSRVNLVAMRDKRAARKVAEALEYPQCHAATAASMSTKSPIQTEKSTALMDLGLRLINLEANFKALEERSDDRAHIDQLRSKILSLGNGFRELVANSQSWTKLEVSLLLEDELTFHQPGPFHAWDRRSYEPLQAHQSDFYPETELALYEVTPKSRDLSVPDLANSREAAKTCADLLKHLFAYHGSPLPDTLDKIAVNAGKDLIPMVPAITDVRRGGRLNPSDFKTRCLTEEMIEGLVKAFFEWPFRPQQWEIALGHERSEGESMEGEATEDEEVEEAAVP